MIGAMPCLNDGRATAARAGVLPLLSCFALFAPGAYAQAPVTAIPFKLVHDLMVIEVAVNGSGPLNFIFDTGANITVIDRAAAERWVTAFSPDTVVIGTAGRGLPATVAVDNTLTLGKEVLPHLPLYAMDLSHFTAVLKIRIDGIIGYDLLERYVVGTDMQTKQLQLTDRGSFVYAGHGTALPMQQLPNNHLVVQCAVTVKGGLPMDLPLIIDTGSDEHVALYSNAMALGLLEGRKKYKVQKSFSVDSTVTSNYRGKLRGFRFGSSELHHVPVIYVVGPMNGNGAADTTAYGRIGQRILNRYNLIYDLGHGTLYIE